MARDIRQRALEKIASLSAASSKTSFDRSDLDRLCKATQTAGKSVNGYSSKQASSSLGRQPMTIREFEVLLSLCKAAPAIQTSQSAQRLVHQLIPYILEAHVQVFVPSPFFRKAEPSPTEALAFHVAAALLSLGSHYDDLHEVVSDNIWAFVNACDHVADRVVLPGADDDDPNLEDAIRTATIAVSLLGFLDAASAQADFWRAGGRLSLITRFRDILSQPFLTAVETAFSTIRNSPSSDRHAKEWKRYLRHYSAAGRPLGAILLQRSFMWLLVSVTSLLVTDASLLRGTHILDLLMSGDNAYRPGSPRSPDADYRSLDMYTTIATEQMDYLEATADYLQLGSSWQQRLAFAVKSATLISYLNCSLVNDEVADTDLLIGWLEEALADSLQMADETLAATVLRSIALVCKIAPSYAATASRLLPRFIVQSAAHSRTVAVASRSLAFILKMLSHDAVITTLYTLGNVLSPGSDRSMANGANGELGLDGANNGNGIYPNRHSTGSSISLAITGEEDTALVYGNVVQAICGIATACNDDKITALAQSMLLQKIDKVNSNVDAQIVSGAAALALKGGQLEFRSLLKVFSRMCHLGVVGQKDFLLSAVLKARTHISANLYKDSPLYPIYWEHLLESIISMGDVHQSNHTKEADVQLAAREIAELLHPLAVFMSTNDLAFNTITDDESHSMIRDAWFNIVVHGFTTQTDMGKAYLDELRVMAIHSPPLVAEQRGEQVESDIELNTVLRRGMSNDRENLQKRHLAELIPNKASEVKNLSYRKVIFLQAAYLVESLRADAGDCTKTLSYFLEPSMRNGGVSGTMEGISHAVVDKYLRKTIAGADATFSAQYAASQLVAIFCGCCHRIERVQQAAFSCADHIISKVPSALCHRSSLFALLELLSLMWSSCLEAETDLYAPRSKFTSSLGDVSVELSDDYSFRRHTLDILNRKAKAWVSSVISLAPLDIKGLLQTYLSEFDDEGAYGHISLGRSFAIELGSLMPSTDQRLQSLDRVGDCSINTGSDFVAQYTTRQEYRYGEILPERGNELMNFMQLNRRASFLTSSSSSSSANESANAATALAHVEARIKSKKNTALHEVRDILRRAAALLCRSERDESAVAHYLVSIPFAMFTKQSIKLGVSLWLGVMNENPRLEPRLLTEIAQQWEMTIQKGQGLFSHAMQHPDPFFLKEEFAPSDLEALGKRKQLVHNILAPHMRLIQFFGSHFNATRLGSPDVQRVFLRLLDVTLDAVRASTPHPMARELRFQIVLFGLKVLHVCTTIGAIAQWRLKEKILSAALSWFKFAPRWSFGSNILQLKTELRLLTDILAALKNVAFIGSNAIDSIKSLQAKEQLLIILLESELTRLSVWVHPLGESGKPHAATVKSAVEASLSPLIRVAWAEDPSVAIELVTRFPYPRIQREVRWLLINFPQKAISEPEALPILLGGSLPTDVSFQLKYLLFWSPVNPITAVTYFLPAYRNHPFLIQYAMRALESHSSDVTFFYVPQIVQTLRYDALGYVERYILETAQFSQLFAHQIIWNMKANAYKDDDATIPDAIKPTLDAVMEKMVDSFSEVDRTFYEREFAFFDEVTDISGKLKPYVGRPKPEKAQKIEEELRKIKVEIGVYLPSNPDGVVIGIDRKSGKPLQSHAKAPYMATFRIKKAKGGLEDVGEMLEDVHKKDSQPQDNMIEVWQSAIFKVGDDCRQDVLALQMIAAFRGIFHDVGLDVYVYPYRVTATAPGCGVIDVLPNSVSRDMLGREAVNGLYDYFISKYGNEDSLRFQQARSNFVKSMAAYSIISFLLQFKDRHNGNIMIDDAGHLLHIDFGFCFDIAPGGIKFERAPFKLTTEMLAVMGGSPHHQSFKWFEELCVKAFLASRQHCEKLSQIVLLMMDSGLPCFKPESVQHFKERFVLERSEREAADFVKDLIRRSANSYSTGVYDQFQLLTNGIPF
ncbi:Phosphatidylinositol 4-kinase STT4 [Colletotrichum orbiculare MAFF 240422]|uniref:1-phosphatidylinositol 4-kinase n=1 Tax=Colletotrichum orbiculare (strain 104-T / ATCC 96160 / CBS 514.97 / LARS 414 / MAFF 240422) TaxID=1213857 RepID=N4UMV4_COLOR|nr:Phosphatidylinositol 4-kinase STT4 [Colletotrichum orbiculare MAFF 240422]